MAKVKVATPSPTPENWAFKAEGSPAEVSMKLTAAQGTIEQNVRFGMQDIIDNASDAVPPAVACTFTASQYTVITEGHVSRKISISFDWNN
jgi:hypothetical protein